MTKEEQVAYEFQALRTIIKELKKSGSVKQDHWKGPMPRELLLDLLETTNYNIPDSRSKAVRKLTSSDPIHIGKDDNGDFYRIVPRFRALLADQPHPATNNELVEEDILGVNINVQPPEPAHPRTADLPEQSTALNDSDNPGEVGFVFFQLGRVEVLYDGEDGEVHSLQDALEGDWMDTRFCAVMRITEGGTADGVYLLYDFYAPNCGESRFPNKDGQYPKEDGQFWGYLGEGTKQFSCARIADRLSDLSLFKPLVFHEVVDHPVEIVRAVMASQGTMVRATVAPSS